LAHVLGVVQSSDNEPTQQSYMVYEDLATQVNAELKKLDGLMGADLSAFNKLIRDENVPAVQAPPKKAAQ
jgi:serine/threonine-protein kinase RIO1